MTNLPVEECAQRGRWPCCSAASGDSSASGGPRNSAPAIMSPSRIRNRLPIVRTVNGVLVRDTLDEMVAPPWPSSSSTCRTTSAMPTGISRATARTSRRPAAALPSLVAFVQAAQERGIPCVFVRQRTEPEGRATRPPGCGSRRAMASRPTTRCPAAGAPSSSTGSSRRCTTSRSRNTVPTLSSARRSTHCFARAASSRCFSSGPRPKAVSSRASAAPRIATSTSPWSRISCPARTPHCTKARCG